LAAGNRRGYDCHVSEESAARKRLREALYYPLKDARSQGRVSYAARQIRRYVANLFFERGIETAGSQVELDHFNRERTPYGPSDWLDLRRALPKRDVGPKDVFVDFGSGKGRIVYQAARYPFARVIGVEISAKLNQVAQANIDRNTQKLTCQNVELVTVDAAAFVIPDDVTVAYFYHPFTDQTFRIVIDNIVESIDHNPRRVKLIYQWPLMESYILETGRFKLARTLKHGRRNLRRIAVYVHEPA
jgi:hypothetical protein